MEEKEAQWRLNSTSCEFYVLQYHGMKQFISEKKNQYQRNVSAAAETDSSSAAWWTRT